MTEEELVQALEAGTLDPAAFTHAAHVRAAWWYLQHDTFSDALWKFSTALRRFTCAHGAAGKYHETITVAFMTLIAARIDASPASSAETFAAEHADLLTPRLLDRYYQPATLQSAQARRMFVFPDAAAQRAK